jgi:hypothetical protein
MKGRQYLRLFNIIKIKAVILQLLFYLLPFQYGYAQTPTDGLVAYWTFDEGTGTTAHDTSVYDHTGTLINGPSWVTGRQGNALSFDGINDYVEINDNNNLDLTGGEFTLSAWIYPESYGEALNGRIIDHGGGSAGDGGWSLLVSNDPNGQNLRQSIINGNSGYSVYSDINSINLNTWQHVAVTLESGTITFYVNGQIKGQTAGVPTPTDRNAPVRIGMRATDFLRAFAGVIDEVRIYDRALAIQDIMDLYNYPPPLSDMAPPVISDGQPAGVLPSGTTSATLSVTTDEAATCKYSTSPHTPYSSMPGTFLSTDGTAHTNPLSDLEDDQSRTYYVKCRDLSGNSSPHDYTVSFSVNRNVYHVSPSGSDSNPGTNVLPFATIQYALDSVVGNTSYDTLIKVAQGTYYENIHIVCCSSSQSAGKNLSIQGGWTNDFIVRDANPSNTVIDGGGKQRVIKINVPALSLTIEGFTIRNGYDSVTGGGIYVFPFYDGNITLTLRNNILARNRAGSYGGGVCVEADNSARSIVTFTDNKLIDNRAGYNGGGVYLRSYSGATIESTFTKNSIDNNKAAYFGAGVYMYSESDATFTAEFANNIIDGNRDVYFGGGVYMHSVSGATFTADFTNNFINSNSASFHGGGIYALSALGGTMTSSFTNNIIAGNSAGYEGGGVFNWGTTTSTFTNNTITENKAYLGGGIRITEGPIVIIAKEDAWKYDMENTGTTWMDPGYDDSLWHTGNGIFGTEENLNITTPISNTNLSMFFRKTFTVGDPATVTALTLNALFDDGFAVYINGTQVYSENVSGDPPLYNGGVTAQHEALDYETRDLTSVIGLGALRSLLVAGSNNVIAVGIYNKLPASSDIVWDGELVVRHKDDSALKDIYNNVIWGNIANFCGDLSIHTDLSGTINAYYNYFDPAKVCAIFTNEGNNINAVNVAPLFVVPGYWDDNGTPADNTDDFWVEGDYHLAGESECIDAGNITAPSIPSIDYEGDDRGLDGTTDIGADDRVFNPDPTAYYCDYDHDGYIASVPSNICYRAECVLLNCRADPGPDCDDKDFYANLDQTWYKDEDYDDYSDGINYLVSCIRPSGYRTVMELTALSGDCNDTNKFLNPDAAEIWYDGIDQNCDGWNDYDQDMDTFVDGNWNNQAGGTSPGTDDCDDVNPIINPDTLWYQDVDGDGFGNPVLALVQCIQPSGPPSYVLYDTDCDDTDQYIYQGGPEVRIVDTPTSYYWIYELQTAYNDALDGETIQIKAESFAGDFSINQGKMVTIEGGYDCSYSLITGVTTLSGDIIITDGSVTVDQFELQLPWDQDDY